MKGRERMKRNRWEAFSRSVLAFFMSLLFSFPVAAGEWDSLERKLGADGFDGKEMADLFQRADLRFDPEPMTTKITELMVRANRQDSGQRKVNRSAVYGRYLRPETMRSAHAYLDRHRALLGRISREYCVPREVVVAVALVETNLGANTGRRRAFDVLASMALSDDLEKVRPFLPPGVLHEGNEDQARQRCREKADWAYRELKYLLKYSRATGVDPLTVPGSILGPSACASSCLPMSSSTASTETAAAASISLPPRTPCTASATISTATAGPAACPQPKGAVSS